ncbi:hypothetical protein ACLB2K_013634 [Fragaria x ananassa]
MLRCLESAAKDKEGRRRNFGAKDKELWEDWITCYSFYKSLRVPAETIGAVCGTNVKFLWRLPLSAQTALVSRLRPVRAASCWAS